MSRDVLLINTNRIKPAVGPIALDYIADSLHAAGLGVRLLDLCFEEDVRTAVRSALGGAEPLLVGLTLRNTDDCYLASGTSFLPGFAEIVRLVREHTSAPIVLGGSGYSVFPSAILELTGADYGIAGDGEAPLAQLASALAGRRDPTQTPGLVCRVGDGFRRNAPWYGDLSALPARARALVDNERYFREGGQGGVETKRGCDRPCIYCADPVGKGCRVRMRTPAQVADEFETLVAQGIDHIHLCDSEFNVPAHHALAVCEELARRRIGEKVRWYTYATPAGFTTELARAMRAAGCVGINFGADSGDDRMLAALGRDFRSAELWETVKACREAGIVVMYDLLLGGPGETRESIAHTIEVMKRISPDRVGVSLGVRVYDGTRLAEMVRAEGPLVSNPNLQGEVESNEAFLRPIFYLSAEAASGSAGFSLHDYVAQLVGGDRRFFFPTTDSGAEGYNYNDNDRLVEAIRQGYRGAYWDVLRRVGET
ncbi:MAG: radical SAM protein [Armatimonadota bacterium]